MSDKEMRLRSIVFLIIGVLLLLSLVICIYIVNSEKDLVAIEAEVADVKKDSDGTVKNDVVVTYRVNNTLYQYNFYYRDDVNKGDVISVYYHEDNVTSVQTHKTNKIIFICPIVGLVLCIIGVFALFKKNKEVIEEEDYETKVISVVGNTEQLKIIPEEEMHTNYVKLPEEEVEVSVKSLVKENKPSHEEISSKLDKLEEDSKEEVFVEREKILPNYYYLSGNTLVYEVMGQEMREIPLQNVSFVVKTINSEKSLVKLTLYTEKIQCVLTNMKDISLEEMSHLIHNKLVSISSSFEEKIEYKEY